MKIAYVCHARFPTEKAYGLQIAQVCQAMGRLGHDVTLLAPTVRNTIHDDAFTYYGVERCFTVEHLEHVDLTSWDWFPGFWRMPITGLLFRSTMYRRLRALQPDIVYLRNWQLLPKDRDLLSKTILELHTVPRLPTARLLRRFAQCKKIVCLTAAMQQELLQLGVPQNLLTVEHDGVDTSAYQNPAPFTTWKFPADRPVIGYVGSLLTQNTLEKGIPELIHAIAVLKERGLKPHCCIVGGPRSAQTLYMNMATTLGLTPQECAFYERLHPSLVPGFLRACRVLAYPAPASQHPYYIRYTSPLKLFEYCAADRSIACADLPPLRDVVNERSVTLCKPGDAASLADAISAALNEDLAAKSAERLRIANEHDWQERMKRVLK